MAIFRITIPIRRWKPYLTMLKDAVVKGGYDIGFAFDGDGDRVGVVDDKGQTLYSDQLLAFLAQDVLRNHPQGNIGERY